MSISFTTIINFTRSAIDLIAVWAILYFLITRLRTNMRTVQLFKGVLFVLIAKLLTSALGLTTLNYLVDSIINWGVLAVIIIFQPEIRIILEKMGQTKLLGRKELSDDDKERYLDELVNAITTLAKDQTGALITFERSESLADYIQTGTKVNADIKSDFSVEIKDGVKSGETVLLPPSGMMMFPMMRN